MEIKVRYGIAVEKSCAEVFAFISDPEKAPQWQSTTFDVVDKKNTAERGLLQRGTQVHDRRNVLGKQIDGEWEVVELEKDKRFVARVTKGPVPWQMTFTVEPIEGGTWLTAEGGGDLGKLPISPVAASRACQSLLENDLRTAADILEKGN